MPQISNCFRESTFQLPSLKTWASQLQKFGLKYNCRWDWGHRGHSWPPLPKWSSKLSWERGGGAVAEGSKALVVRENKLKQKDPKFAPTRPGQSFKEFSRDFLAHGQCLFKINIEFLGSHNRRLCFYIGKLWKKNKSVVGAEPRTTRSILANLLRLVPKLERFFKVRTIYRELVAR